jgi:hypothetical protein
VITAACTVSFSAELATYSVTPSGTHVTISPQGARTIDHGATTTFTVTAASGYVRSNTVGGTCPAGSWSGDTYTTGAITTACSVSFSAVENPTVTISGSNVTLSPTGAQSVSKGSTLTISATADSGYDLPTAVGGTCPAGAWDGSDYTTGEITAGCTVSITATRFKRIFVSATGSDGDLLTGVSGADSICSSDGYKPAGDGTYKALLGGTGRIACTTANCTGGAAENSGWVLRPSTTYVRTDYSTVIFKTNAAAITLTMQNDFNSSIQTVWTGLNSDWTASSDNCSSWLSNSGPMGSVGSSVATPLNVPNALSWGTANCMFTRRFLCVEQ